ncbi:MAG: hypothetical protein JXR94_03980, partial [Candidatus Hydrogenedentes bacterium]|nr:hypothetical protein [Candidatus Hydrogenedentota bacterium]
MMRPSKLFHPTRLREIRFIRRWLREAAPGAVCDFGCGDGVYSQRFADRHAVFGFDPWHSQVRKTAASFPGGAKSAWFLVA